MENLNQTYDYFCTAHYCQFGKQCWCWLEYKTFMALYCVPISNSKDLITLILASLCFKA